MTIHCKRKKSFETEILIKQSFEKKLNLSNRRFLIIWRVEKEKYRVLNSPLCD